MEGTGQLPALPQLLAAGPSRLAVAQQAPAHSSGKKSPQLSPTLQLACSKSELLAQILFLFNLSLTTTTTTTTPSGENGL